MSLQLTFSDLVNGAAKLDFKEYEKFVETVNSVRAGKQLGAIDGTELELLAKINRGYPMNKWERLQQLDEKLEDTALTQEEYAELTALTIAYERYCVQRIRLLKKLSFLRKTSLEETIQQLG